MRNLPVAQGKFIQTIGTTIGQHHSFRAEELPDLSYCLQDQ